MQEVSEVFILGRAEWVSLPELGLLAIKAKVDTGAKTSALHARSIERFGPAAAPKVRFEVQPIPARPEIVVVCTAPIADRRDVMSSNGERECRFIISTPIRIDRRRWTIEIGLTNREPLTHRMLLGRQAIRPGMLVDPTLSFAQPKLSSRLYRR